METHKTVRVCRVQKVTITENQIERIGADCKQGLSEPRRIHLQGLDPSAKKLKFKLTKAFRFVRARPSALIKRERSNESLGSQYSLSHPVVRGGFLAGVASFLQGSRQMF